MRVRPAEMEYQLLSRNFEQLQAERRKAAPKPGAVHFALHAAGGPAPTARLLPVGPGLEVAAQVTAPPE